jgi:hypothetical protein
VADEIDGDVPGTRADAAAATSSTHASLTALDTLYRTYCAFRDGAIDESEWNGAIRAASILMATPQFRREWVARQSQFPAEFRFFMVARTKW